MLNFNKKHKQWPSNRIKVRIRRSGTFVYVCTKVLKKFEIGPEHLTLSNEIIVNDTEYFKILHESIQNGGIADEWKNINS